MATVGGFDRFLSLAVWRGALVSYASPLGRALIDRRLYVPRSWIDDTDRCADAGIPDDLAFATKPQLAWQMIADTLAAASRASCSLQHRAHESA